MNKTIVIILGLTVGLLTGLLVFSLNYFSAAKKPETTATVEISPTPAEEKTIWDDQSGFTFEYPKSLTLNSHEEDNENYAHVELTSGNRPGNIIVWARDTSASTLEALMKQKKATGSIDSTLGGSPAKKYISQGETKNVTVSTLFNGYLYEVETNLANSQDDSYWNRVSSDVISSFKFKPVEAGSDTGTAVNQDAGEAEDYGTDEDVIE